MKFDGGVVGHFVLMPDNEFMDVALAISEKILIPLGISYISGKLLQGNHRVITTLADVGNDMITIPYIQKICREFRSRQHSYYAVENGEQVFKYPVTVDLL